MPKLYVLWFHRRPRPRQAEYKTHYDKFLKVLKKLSIHLSSILSPPLGFNLALGQTRPGSDT